MHAKSERHEFEITIDGEEYTLEEKEMSAADLLALADKSYETSYLVEMKGNREKEEYPDGTVIVKIHNNMTFISVHTGATPVSW